MIDTLAQKNIAGYRILDSRPPGAEGAGKQAIRRRLPQ